MKKRILAVLMALVMIFSCLPVSHTQAAEVTPTASGTTYYVSSVHGANGNNGTSESTPFASLLTINEITLQPGDRVLLERGSVFVDEYLHVKGSGSETAPIIIDAYGDESLPKPLIQTNGNGVWYQDYGKRLDNTLHKYYGNVSSCILLYDVEYIEISNIAMTNEGNFAAGEVYNSLTRIDRTGVAGIAENIGTVDHIYLRNLDVRNVQGHVRNKHMANGGIYLLCHNPDDVNATGPAKFDDVLIEGCRLDEVNRWGIAVGYTAHWDQFAYGPSIDADICRTYGSTNVVIRNNYLTNVGGDGITTMYCYQPVMEYNVLDGYCQDMTTEIYGPSDGQLVAAGIWPWMCKTAILQYNEAYNSTANPDGQAWDADWGDNAIYQYNYSSNNAGGAVMFCGQYACNTVFRYNISQNDLAGVLNLASSPNGEIYNNVFYIKEGVKVNRSGMSGGWGNTISNNIFYYAGSTPADATLGNWGDITAEWNSNIYYNYATIPNDANAITADPLFVDPGKGPSGAQASGLAHDRSAFEGYKLQPNSPAIDAGVPIANNGGLDFFGNALDLLPDIGVYDAGTCESDASRAQVVNVPLGQTVTITDLTGNYADTVPVVDDSKIADVSITGNSTTIRSCGNAVTSLTDGKYLLVNNRAGKTMLNLDAAAQEGEAASMAGLQLEGTRNNISGNAVWTVTASGSGHTIQDADGKYLSIVQNDANVISEESIVTVVYSGGNWTLSQNGYYLNDAANKAVCASGWNGDGVYNAATDAGSLWTIYPVSEETVSSTELTFTGLYPGSTNIQVDDTLYLVRVSGNLQEVELDVGDTATFTDESGNYTTADTSALDADVATVSLSGIMTEAYSLGAKVTSLTSGSKYILVNTRSGKPVTNLPATAAADAGAGSGLSLNGAKEDAALAAIWTITAGNSGYTVQDLDGNYMTVGSNTADVTANAATLALNYNGSTWTISGNGAYLNHFGGQSSTCAAGWQDSTAAGDAGSQWDIYQVNTTTAENGTQIVFTAMGSGESHVQIGNTMYHITVTGAVCNHPNTEIRDAVEADCTTEGYTGDTWCLDCGIVIASGTTIPALGHTPGEAVNENEIAPSCTEAGSYESVVSCTVCGEELSRETVNVPALGHDWENGECTRCDEKQEAPARNPFIDVKETDFFYDAVLWAVDEGIVAGTTATTFTPNGSLLRAQFVTFLWRHAGQPEPATNVNPFIDVKSTDYFYKAVLWAVEEGIVAGISSNQFAPNMVTTRAQAISFLWRYLDRPEATAVNSFKDVVAGEWYAPAVDWAVGAGVTSGISSTMFGVNSICNRAQAVSFLYRALHK